jgi:hypothetical protein
VAETPGISSSVIENSSSKIATLWYPIGNQILIKLCGFMNKKYFQRIIVFLLPVMFLCSSVYIAQLRVTARVIQNLRVISQSSADGLRCGFDASGAEEALTVHREHRLRSKGNLDAITVQGLPSVQTAGDIALIQDDGSIVMQPNGFDLKNNSILFTPDGNGYRTSIGAIGFNGELGARLNDYLGNDDLPLEGANNGYKEISLSTAPFKFFNIVYDKIFISTNGFISFNRGDTTTRVSAAALAKEMPRLAPLWADLDVTDGGGIFYHRLNDRHLITWNKAPQAQYSGANTFQAALYDDGRIVFAYKKVKARNAMIGIAPGASTSDALPLNFSEAQDYYIDGATFESFSKQKRLDIPALTRSFFNAMPDAFDTVYLWTDFAFDNGPGYATSFIVRNDIQGIGVNQFDKGGMYGSASRLSSIIVMGDVVGSWIDDPNAHVVGLYSAVAITCHEQAHRWTSYIRFNTNRGVKDDLLGRDLSHWSFLMDTRTNENGSFSSLMEGNAWSGGTSGTFKTIESSANHFSELDQYLMGLRASSEVSDLNYIDIGDQQLHASLRMVSPASNFTIGGDRKTVSIDRIIEHEGARVPDVTTSPKEFRIAFILLTEGGHPPSTAVINKTDNYRSALVKYFGQATGRRGSLNSSLTEN